MAIVSTITCRRCSQSKDVWHSPGDPKPLDCHECRADLAQKAREEALVQLAALPIGDRLRRIEEWIYDYKPPVSLRDMRF